jgi:hypothetical protein
MAAFLDKGADVLVESFKVGYIIGVERGDYGRDNTAEVGRGKRHEYGLSTAGSV